MNANIVRQIVLITMLGLFLVSGCAEGPLWRTGKYAPWVNKQWAAEEQIAETIFSKRDRLRSLVKSASASGPDAQEKAAQQLLAIVQSDPIHLMKIEAVNLLPELDGPSVIAGLQAAAMDSAADVRMAAIRGLEQKASPTTAALVANIANNDTDLDNRIAATRALAAFEGEQVYQALDQALTDSNPAIQTVAINSLEKMTGQALERDVNIWRNHIAGATGKTQATANSGTQPKFQ